MTLLNLSVIRYFRGTCLSVEMLKEYMVRERLRTPGLEAKHRIALTHER